jgi:hypothetical protein
MRIPSATVMIFITECLRQGMGAVTHHGRAGCLLSWSKVQIWMARLINDGSTNSRSLSPSLIVKPIPSSIGLETLPCRCVYVPNLWSIHGRQKSNKYIEWNSERMIRKGPSWSLFLCLIKLFPDLINFLKIDSAELAQQQKYTIQVFLWHS